MVKTRKDGKSRAGFGGSLLKKAEQAEIMKKDQKPANGKDTRSEKSKGDSGTKRSATIGDTKKKRKGGSQQNVKETSAEDWEKVKLEKLNIRYKKMYSTIMNWENGEKAKARRHLNKIESEVNRRRAKASREYQLDVSRTEKIAEGAKYLAEERRRNEQSAVKEKANKYRKTGKNPESCFGIPMSFPCGVKKK